MLQDFSLVVLFAPVLFAQSPGTPSLVHQVLFLPADMVESSL
jgi:hypothetical protein